MAKRTKTTSSGGEVIRLPAVTATATIPSDLTEAVREAMRPAVPVITSTLGAREAESEALRLKLLKMELERRFTDISKPFNTALRELRQFKTDLLGRVEERLRLVSEQLVEWRQQERARLAAEAKAIAQQEQARAVAALEAAATVAPTPKAQQSLAQQAAEVATAPVYVPTPEVAPMSDLVEVRRRMGEVTDMRLLVIAVAATEMLASLEGRTDVPPALINALRLMRGVGPVPLDVLTVDQTALNRYAREVNGQVIWPGVAWRETVTLARKGSAGAF